MRISRRNSFAKNAELIWAFSGPSADPGDGSSISRLQGVLAKYGPDTDRRLVAGLGTRLDLMLNRDEAIKTPHITKSRKSRSNLFLITDDAIAEGATVRPAYDRCLAMTGVARAT